MQRRGFREPVRSVCTMTALWIGFAWGGRPVCRAGEVTVRPACAESCPPRHVEGIEVIDKGAGSLAAPIGSTYSFQHLIGGDVRGDGNTTCFFIFDPSDPPPGAPDDVVVFDGVPEDIRTDIRGTVPTVTESMIDTGDGTRTLILESTSPSGTDLFPGGETDPDNPNIPLTDACLFVGLVDPLDWAGFGAVLDANIIFLKDGATVAGPITLDPALFADPWNGRLLVSFSGLAGQGINHVRLRMRVEKVISGPVNACCIDGICRGDVDEQSCAFQGGVWQIGASCGSDPTRPQPICDHPPCGYDNGLPLDDAGGPVSQFSPDLLRAAAGADDFVLRGTDGYCVINQVRAWMTHVQNPAPIDPSVDYQAVTVTIYRDAGGIRPRGEPRNDGTHEPDVPGGIVYTRTIPIDRVIVTAEPVLCLNDAWRLDIPVDIVLRRNLRYWLEVQPVMNAAKGQAVWMLSENQNELPARAFGPHLGIVGWGQVSGNDDACPDGSPPTPPADTRWNLAFALIGGPGGALRNDDCNNALPLEDGITPYTTNGATTDGPPEPATCQFFFDSQVGSDVWFEYTASCTGEAVVSLCGSEYDTKMAAYAGCGRCPPDAPPVACNDESCLSQSEVNFPVSAGACYRIRVGGFQGAQGDGIVSVTCQPPPDALGACCVDLTCAGTLTRSQCEAASGTFFLGQNCDTFVCPIEAPPHDECPACIPLETGVPYTGTTRGSGGSDVSSCGFNDRNDVWHCWTADCTGNAKISLCDQAGLDTTLAVYDACGGTELGCNDDECNLQSAINPLTQLKRLAVFEGETYFIRVSGFNGAVGEYTIVVDSCVSGCCLPGGRCLDRQPADCEAAGGIPLPPGTFCRGDINGDGVNDACPACPPVTSVFAMPGAGAVDARQPYPPDDPTALQGIGPPAEPIRIMLDPPVVGAPAECFRLCETDQPAGGGANDIATVVDEGNGVYRLELLRPITPYAVTKIRYFGSADPVTLISHPGNSDGDASVSPLDVAKLMDCCLRARCLPTWRELSCDIDHSGSNGAGDLLRLIDLFNGAGSYPAALGSAQPDPSGCP